MESTALARSAPNLFPCRSEQRIVLPMRLVVLELVCIAKHEYMMWGARQMKQGGATPISRMSKVESPVLDAVKWCFGMGAVTTLSE